MSLPPAWVDRIFEKLSLVYGHQFLSRWDGLPLDQVKADWAFELSRFQQNIEAIKYALTNLPAGHPPDVLQFRQLCRAYTKPTVPSISAPFRELPEQFRQAIAQLSIPVNDDRPERVRVASRYIDMWGTGKQLTPRQRDTLAEMREIVSRFEADEVLRKQRELAHGAP